MPTEKDTAVVLDELMKIAEELEIGYFDGCGVRLRYMVSSEQVLMFEREMAARIRKLVKQWRMLV